MPGKKYYIGRRDNPQFPKPYYNKYGQLTKAEAKKKENCLYGSLSLTGYDTRLAYDQRVMELTNQGFTVNTH